MEFTPRSEPQGEGTAYQPDALEYDGAPEPLSQQDLSGADGYPIYSQPPTSLEIPGSVSVSEGLSPSKPDSHTVSPELVWGDEGQFHEAA